MTEGTRESQATAEAPITAVPSELPPEPPAVTMAGATPKRGGLRRLLNWFWRGRELRQLKQDVRAESPRVRELALRARLSFELGERASRPAEPLPGSADAAAAELFREAAYWAARALASARDPDRAHEPWAVLGTPLLEKAAGSAERAPELVRIIDSSSFTESWELPLEQRAQRAAELSRAAKALLDELAWPVRARDALLLQRVVRLGLLLVAVLVTLGTVSWVSSRSEQARDVAVGKPWRASSTLSSGGCTSPLQECGENSDYFFHTNNEPNPWLELDLGKVTTFSAVRVDNRKDCCFDRAVPLVVEVSRDQKEFREVARRTTTFSSWLATFSPTEARYVRLRVPRQSLLHLSRVRVLR